MGLEVRTVPPLGEEFWSSFFEGRKLLDSAKRRGIFLLGSLFGRVERVQRKERGWTGGRVPILELLRGLTISEGELEQLLPRIVLKIRELGVYSRSEQEVEAAAGHYLSQGGRIGDNEAVYIFCLGWVMSQDVFNSVIGRLAPEERRQRGERS